MRNLFFCLLFSLLGGPSAAAEKPAKFDEKAVDAILQKAMTHFGSPGLACVIVKGDEVVYLKGHGVRDIDSKKPVTPDTLFAIASNSKAFTATAIALLVADGKMSWDDPVRKHLPTFRMSDELADREVTIRDLLCHRTGVIRHDIIWIVHPMWDRDEMIRRSGLLKPDRSFRSVSGYNNFQFLAAGVASGKAAGLSWEELVRKRLFDPLGMKSSNFDSRDLVKAADHALPHLKPDGGSLQVLTPCNIENMAPAGAINSSVRDLSHWLRFQLGEGSFEGKRLLPASVLRETYAPHAIVQQRADILEAKKLYDGISTQQSYGLGWRVSDYRGKRMVSHGGSLFGYRSDVTIFPDQKFAVAVLTNLADSSLPLAASHALADHLLDAPPRDWNDLFMAQDRKLKDDEKKKDEERLVKRKANAKPSLGLNGYVGTFEESRHGAVRISVAPGGLQLHWGDRKLDLEHFHFDTFLLKGVPEVSRFAWGDRQITFQIDASGTVEGFRYQGQEFKKKRTSKR